MSPRARCSRAAIDGKGGGSDTLDLSGYTTVLDVNLTSTGATDGFDGNTTGSATDPITGTFSDIDTIKAGSSGNDTLTGLATAGTWNLNAVTTYVNGNTLTFSGFDTLDAGAGGDTFKILANQTLNLNGGAGADSFLFSNGKVLTGSIDGEGGSDTLDLSLYSTNLSVNLTTVGATNGFDGNLTGSATVAISGGFSHINEHRCRQRQRHPHGWPHHRGRVERRHHHDLRERQYLGLSAASRRWMRAAMVIPSTGPFQPDREPERRCGCG